MVKEWGLGVVVVMAYLEQWVIRKIVTDWEEGKVGGDEGVEMGG